MQNSQKTEEMKNLYVWFLKEANDKGFHTLILVILVGVLGLMWKNDQELNRKQMKEAQESSVVQNKEWISILTEVVNKNTTVIELNRLQNERVERALVRLEKK